jgi:hypothetical protein
MSEPNQGYFDFVKERLNPLGIRKATLTLTPYVLRKEFHDRLARLSVSYARILEDVFQRYSEDERIRDVLGYGGELEELLGDMTVYPRNMALARLDMFDTGDGLFMVESNTETPGGNEECTALEEGFQRFFPGEGGRRLDRLATVLETLMDHYRVQMGHKGLAAKEKPVINLITWDWDIQRIRGEYDVLIDYVRGKGCRCDIIDPNKIVFEGGDAINPEMGERVDLFYRRFTTDELPKHARDGFDLARHLDGSSAAVVNPFCTKRVDSKNIMVLVKDGSFEGIFSEEVLADVRLVREILPWTRRVAGEIEVDGRSVDGREYLLREKDRLVVKEANSYSSVGVFIGEDHEPDEWAGVVDRALGGDFIVQEKIALPTLPVRLYDGVKESTQDLIYNVNPYMFNGDFGGIYVRASSDKLTSFKVGGVATVLPVFLESTPSSS